MQSEQSHDREESSPPAEEASRLRPVLKVRDERLSSDHIHLSPQAQRRMARSRRSGY
jgi:hypothetical protein